MRFYFLIIWCVVFPIIMKYIAKASVSIPIARNIFVFNSPAIMNIMLKVNIIHPGVSIFFFLWYFFCFLLVDYNIVFHYNSLVITIERFIYFLLNNILVGFIHRTW